MGRIYIKPVYLTILVLSIFLLLVSLIARWYFSNSNITSNVGNQLSQITPTPTKSTKILPSGGQIYRFSHGQEVIGPKIQTVTISNLTPAIKETQSISVVIKNDSPVTDAQVTVTMDGNKKITPLKLSQGTSNEGTWVASWNVSGSYDYQYSMNFDLKSSTGEYLGGLTFR